MRGRVQAAAVAFLGNWLPLVSPATVGLVALRKGPLEGLLILLWALLPTLLVVGALPLAANLTIASLVVLWLVAIQLRVTRLWSRVLLAVVVLSGVSGVLLGSAFAEDEMIEQMKGSLEKITGERPPDLGIVRGEVLAFIGLVMAVVTTGGLILARWWQAMLYNPGGFRAEFHHLRFQMRDALLLVAAVLVCTVIGGSYTPWINLLALPLLIAGIALVHWLTAQRQWGVHTLVMFYIGLIVLMPLFVPVLVVVGFTDSIADLRTRLGNGAR